VPPETSAAPALGRCRSKSRPTVWSDTIAIAASARSRLQPRPPPSLGEHTEAVLKEVAGFGETEVKALREKKIIG